MLQRYKQAKVEQQNTSRPRKRKVPLDQPKMSELLPKAKSNHMSKFESLQVKFVVGGFHPDSTVEETGYKNMVKGNIQLALLDVSKVSMYTFRIEQWSLSTY